jgi:hypothetical protein
MARIACRFAVAVCVGWGAYAFEEPEGLRDRFLQRMKIELERLPDFVCTQSIERFSRTGAEKPWEKTDALRFEVALVGSQELYALPGERQFRGRPLAEFAGRGSISTGQLALLAKHVFLTSTAQFSYHAETERDGRSAHEYSYDVPAKKSSYRLRFGNTESVVPFQGRFWIDAKTEDLILLEVQAYDIPEELALAETETALTYSRVGIDGADVLLPLHATLRVATVDGAENLNRTSLGSCKHYRSESTIRFAAGETASPDGAAPAIPGTAAQPVKAALPKGALLEVTLDASLDPAASKIGDTVKATVVRAMKDGERLAIPPGVTVTGHVVRLDKKTLPFPIHEIGLEFETVEIGGRSLPLAATMEDAGPAPGLLRQSKGIDPEFTKRRTSRIDILVREVQRGQGILEWDARRGALPRGLRMKWRLQGETPP